MGAATVVAALNVPARVAHLLDVKGQARPGDRGKGQEQLEYEGSTG
ncbi:MAG: hypothetical protein V3U63_04080 [Gemmatimonadota bacterium]